MATFILTILILLLIAAGIFLYVQYGIQLKKAADRVSSTTKPARKSIPIKRSSSTTQWKAVKVQTGLMCCKQAEKMRDQIFLTADAPAFPLNKCNSKSCECKYIHMDDRRDGHDRRESTEFLNDLYDLHQKDRRKIKDRRAENL